MPNHKKERVQPRANREDANNNNNDAGVHVHENNNIAPGRAAANHANDNQRLWQCCVPSGCTEIEELIDPADPRTAVKVFCNNENCTVGQWMHKVCFEEWEQGVLAYLRSCGRARSWSEKQRLQNLWTKKGYDLAFKACDCKCEKGHLRKDLNYFSMPTPVDNAVAKKKKNKKKNDKPVAVLSNGAKPHVNMVNASATSAPHPVPTLPTGHNANNPGKCDNVNNNVTGGNVNGLTSQPQLRLRTDSIGSTGSSPPNSSSSTSDSPTPLSPINSNLFFKPPIKPRFDFFTDPSQAAVGNIFRRRHDLSAFNLLPRHKQNPYHIKMEDEGPHGNDDTRCFVLSHLSSFKITSLNCVLCKSHLPVFDRYPLIDGTFFLSPQSYDEGPLQVISEGRLQYINAVCVKCLEGGTDVRCAACKRKWDGSMLLLGSMYAYDIFAAMPCCQKRLSCKHCRRAVVDVTNGLSYYSEYSRMIACPYCKAYDYHFIRPLTETFLVKRPIWN